MLATENVQECGAAKLLNAYVRLQSTSMLARHASDLLLDQRMISSYADVYLRGLWLYMGHQARMEEAAMLAPTLRKSTRERIEEAERERQLIQQVWRLWMLLLASQKQAF